MRFRNRTEAGQKLALHLLAYRELDDVLVLGLVRGGVAVAFPVADALHAVLDVFVVRKVGVPGQQELAMGAVASGGVVVRNPRVLHALGVSENVFQQAAAREHDEVVRREQFYRPQRPGVEPRGRAVVLIDDGLATGASMRAAVGAVRQCEPASLVVAVPVAPLSVAGEFHAMLDDFICIHEHDDLDGVSRWYEDFRQTTDAEVRRLLDESAHLHQAGFHDA